MPARYRMGFRATDPGRPGSGTADGCTANPGGIRGQDTDDRPCPESGGGEGRPGTLADDHAPEEERETSRFRQKVRIKRRRRFGIRVWLCGGCRARRWMGQASRATPGRRARDIGSDAMIEPSRYGWRDTGLLPALCPAGGCPAWGSGAPRVLRSTPLDGSNVSRESGDRLGRAPVTRNP